MNSWILDAETSINSIVKKRAKDALIEDYPDLFFTQDSVSQGDPTFPTIFIHFLPGVELGADLEGKTINAMISTAQVDVTVSREQGMNGARIVAMTVLDEFKKLGFEVASMPEFVGNTLDTKRMVFRVRRTIGSLDTF